MKFDMNDMHTKIVGLVPNISIGKLVDGDPDYENLISGSYDKCEIVDDDTFPTNGYKNFKCKIYFNSNDNTHEEYNRDFVFLQPYGDYDIPEKFWKKLWYKEIVDHCCAVDSKGIVYIVYKFENYLSLDAITDMSGEHDNIITKIMCGDINHKRPYRFTWVVDDLMAFIMKEFGYDNLRRSLAVSFDVN